MLRQPRRLIRPLCRPSKVPKESAHLPVNTGMDSSMSLVESFDSAETMAATGKRESSSPSKSTLLTYAVLLLLLE
jgi:hypothetical protein